MPLVHPYYPTLEQVSANEWQVASKVWMDSDHVSHKIVVPIGFRTDGASVPRMLWPVMPPMSNYTNAAVIHDYLYKTHEVKDRATADAIFLEAMEFLGVGRLKRYTMYSAVRAFGGKPWSTDE